MGKGKSKNLQKKKKINLVFDEAKRKDFLCGFRKRKLERKKKAQDELQRMLKEERKRIKQENKESYKKLVVSSRPIPELDQLLQDEYEDDDVNVKIVELSSDTLQKRDLVIGENKPKETKIHTVKKKKDNGLAKEILGMGYNDENEVEVSESEGKDEENNLQTKKEVKKMLKKQATKKIQKSKVFQMKSKLDRVQNKKKSIQNKGHMKAKCDNSKHKRKRKVGKKKPRNK